MEVEGSGHDLEAVQMPRLWPVQTDLHFEFVRAEGISFGWERKRFHIFKGGMRTKTLARFPPHRGRLGPVLDDPPEGLSASGSGGV